MQACNCFSFEGMDVGFWKSEEEEGVRCLMEFEKLIQHSVEKNVEGSGNKSVGNHASIVVALISCKNNHLQRKLLL